MSKSTYLSLLVLIFVVGLAIGLVFWNVTEESQTVDGVATNIFNLFTEYKSEF
ncbi:hypothetical protein [Oceanobacillus halophilus]|uniref:hypothetical protein n=1 Tax=Oceanobacillus halophilus TaxID=930130 RepID=UPI001313F37A|nr:hypothetical protein [Oceanobacillus halophilus]